MALPFGLAGADLFGVALVLVGVVVLAASARYVWRATLVFRAPDTDDPSGDRTGAFVRVSGTVARAEADPLVAPFSGSECVALRYRIEERRLSPMLLLPWYVTVHETAGAVAFAVRTAAGTVPVVESPRTVALAEHVVATTRSDEEPPARIRTFEREHVSPSSVWRDPPAALAPLCRALSLGTRRYTEQRIGPGDDVTVVGRVTDESGIDPLVVSNRSPSGTLLRMTRTAVTGVLVGAAGMALGAFLLVGTP